MEIEKQHNQDLWNRFIRLGDMMGDGLHHESDGKWISREYKKLAKILIPEMKEAESKRRKSKAENTNKQMQSLFLSKKCTCGGDLKQSRSGSKIAYCTVCNSRFKAVKNKK